MMIRLTSNFIPTIHQNKHAEEDALTRLNKHKLNVRWREILRDGAWESWCGDAAVVAAHVHPPIGGIVHIHIRPIVPLAHQRKQMNSPVNWP